MSLIIALLLIFIIGMRVLDDKVGVWQYEQRSSNWRAQHDKWVSEYVDEELESRIMAYISNRANANAIEAEVSPVLELLKHQRKYSQLTLYDDYDKKHYRCSYDTYMSRLRKDREFVLNILLANRGKVTSWAAVFGYKAYIHFENERLKTEQYEFVEWIRDTINTKGKSVELVYSGAGDSRSPADSYYWVGTCRSMPLPEEVNPQRFKPFSRDLIENKITHI